MSFYDNINDNLWIHTHSLHVCFFLVTQLAISAFFLPAASNKEFLYSTITCIFSVQAFLFITMMYSLITRPHINSRQVCIPPRPLGNTDSV